MTRALRLITFDVTGTLLEFRTPVAVKYSECAKKFNIEADPEIILKNFKLQWKNMSIQHPNFGRDTGLGWENWWTQVVVKSFSPAVPDVGETLLKKLAENLIEEYKTDRCWMLADGALNLLKLLKEKNLLLGVISNFDERLEIILHSLCIHSYFDVIVSSYKAGVMKPNKRIFDYVLKEMKQDSLLPGECLHIGNSVEFDYVGAKNAGWQAFYFGSPSADNINAVDTSCVFQSFHQLQGYFSTKF